MIKNLDTQKMVSQGERLVSVLPKGREEGEFEWPMAWQRYPDRDERKSDNTRRVER
jgi:hypothetical protein